MRKAATVLIGVASLGLLGVGVSVGAAMWFTCMPGPLHAGPLEPMTAEQSARSVRLSQHVHTLAGTIGERHLDRANELLAASDYIEEVWRMQGHTVHRDCYDIDEQRPCNLVVVIGQGQQDPVVVGAHYDTAFDTPGADDNASGVAVLLELTRELSEADVGVPVRFIAFANEEPPWFRSEYMGSAVDAQRMADRAQRPRVMFSLEMLGSYSDEPGSQGYPIDALTSLYGDRGDYVAFVGNLASVNDVRAAVWSFRHGVGFPAFGSALPEQVQGVDYSDHLNYWRHGWPALMVTDTSFNRNHRYHEPDDLPHTLDYDRMSRVVDGLKAVISEASN